MSSRGRPRRSQPERDYTIQPLDALPVVESDDETAASKRRNSAPPREDSDDSDHTGYDDEEEDRKQARADGTLHEGKARARESSSDDDDDDEDPESSGESDEPGAEPTPSVASSAPEEKITARPTTKKLPEKAPRAMPFNVGPRRQAQAAVKPKPVIRVMANRGPLSAPDAGYHPIFEPPLRRFADQDDDDEDVDGEIVESYARDVAERSAEARELSAMPHGPERYRLQDMGWNMGKWNAEGVNQRWGGWYDNIRGIKNVVLTKDAAEKYLPQQAYPAKHQRVNLDPPPDEAEEEDVEDEDESSAIEILMGSLAKGAKPQKKVKLEAFESKRLDKIISTKPGHIFNAGGPISGAAWLPRAEATSSYSTEYLAISTLSANYLDNQCLAQPALLQIWSLDTSVRSDLWRTTQDEKGAGAKFELGLCHGCGDAWDIAWCPRGGTVDSTEEGETLEEDVMGIIAGAFTDGSISLFAVPHPRSVGKGKGKKAAKLHIEAKPILRLKIADSRCLSFAWGSHETIAGGYINGNVAIWSVGDALRSEDPSSLRLHPIQYFAVHNACIRSISFIQVPPLSDAQNGSLDLDAEPTMLLTAGYDGQAFVVDLKDPQATAQIYKERSTQMAIAFDYWSGAALLDDADNRLRALYLKADDFGSTKKLTIHRGPIWSMSISPVHPFVATASADGTVQVINSIRGARRIKSTKDHITKKVFRIDFNRQTGEYRMVDNIKYEQRSTLEAHRKTKGKHAKTPERYDPLDDRSIRGWSPEVGIYRVAWCPSLRRSGLLVSGSACGIGRIDWVLGTHGAPDPANKEATEVESDIEMDMEEEEDEEEDQLAEDQDFDLVDGALVMVKRKSVARVLDDEEDEAPLQRTNKKGKGKAKRIVEDDEMDVDNDWQTEVDQEVPVKAVARPPIVAAKSPPVKTPAGPTKTKFAPKRKPVVLVPVVLVPGPKPKAAKKVSTPAEEVHELEEPVVAPARKKTRGPGKPKSEASLAAAAEKKKAKAAAKEKQKYIDSLMLE